MSFIEKSKAPADFFCGGFFYIEDQDL